MKKTITLVLLLLNVMVHAQISSGSPLPDAHAQLDITAENKGILIPRIALLATNNPNPINNTATAVPNSLLVYNTVTTTGVNAVVPGYYYWNQNRWNRLLMDTDLGAITGTGSWNRVGTTIPATNNTDDIYQQGRVGIGYTSTKTALDATLDVNGDALINGITVGRGTGAFVENTVIGNQAFQSNTTGSFNTVIGYRALNKNTLGHSNTAIGRNTLNKNNTGSDNTAIGSLVLSNNTTGGKNIAIGTQSLGRNISGSNNIAFGHLVLGYNDTGSNNIASGYSALGYNDTGSNNIATGYQALFSNKRGNNNIAFGHGVLYTNLSGSNNIATGYQALYNNRAGDYNIGSGYQALYNNRAGANNIATGTEALYNNDGGDYNIGSGSRALYYNRSGNSNIASGSRALFYNTVSNNIAIGEKALYNNTTGGNNIAIGHQAFNNNDMGSNNIAIGYSTINNTKSAYDNSISIGHDVAITSSNSIWLGNNNITDFFCAVGLTVTSDIRLKKEIKTIPLGLSFINKLRPVEYYRNNNPTTKEWGLVAQELQETINSMGYKNAGIIADDNTEEKILSVRYNDLMAPMIKAIQELAAENDILKKNNTQQQEAINELKAMMEKITQVSK